MNPVWQAQPHMTPPETWTLTLNRYQRDNLLRLIQDVMEGNQRPVGRHNTGDWVGEIRWMLGKQLTGGHGPGVKVVFDIDEDDRPNPIYEPPEKRCICPDELIGSFGGCPAHDQ